MTFSSPQYSRLKNRLQQKYKRDLKAVSKELKLSSGTKLAWWWFDHQEELAEYSSFKWFFLKQVKTFLKLSKLLPQLSSSPEDFTELDDEVFELWNQSEFADTFLKSLNAGNGIKKASLRAFKEMDHHLVVLGERHLLKNNSAHAAYRVQTSLGEIKKAGKVSRLLETTLHLEGKELILYTHSLKEMKKISQRIEVALKVIKKFSPDSWERFRAFTQAIIPIKQKEFVSYSHQELPGYSMINLYDRDFVDLMDDLLHENGHHHLNYYLNLSKLIDEPLDNIYYSPWRRTLRPLRGIYHAYFTFFWAFRLFASLASAKEQDSIFYLFSPEEKEKIYWRAIEEWWMLNYSFEDLKRARRLGLIKDAGWILIQEQQAQLKKFKNKIPLWEKNLKRHRKELKELKRSLSSVRKLYELK